MGVVVDALVVEAAWGTQTHSPLEVFQFPGALPGGLHPGSLVVNIVLPGPQLSLSILQVGVPELPQTSVSPSQ